MSTPDLTSQLIHQVEGSVSAGKILECTEQWVLLDQGQEPVLFPHPLIKKERWILFGR